MKLRVEHKFSLAVYAWGTITGIISGISGTFFEGGWLVGVLLFLLGDKFILAVLKELPEDVPAEKGPILRKAFWGWLLLWLYFTMMSYTLLIKFTPVCYSNQSLLYQMIKSGNASLECVVNFTG
ncbi:MAG: hypothetical protein PWQ79_1492 [Thermococcaceae archaeon]|nr:hypothetical protein [Thermococcaceae archaeon]MDK2914577.1 hypothetical protein [Thermococcaceae archaeon]